MDQELRQGTAPGAAAASGNSAVKEQVKVVSCVNCQGPVADNAGTCFACGSPLTGKEFPYIPRFDSGPDIAGMIKWWAILSVIAFALGGFSFGIGSTLAFTAITAFYGLRILKAYYL